MHMVRVISLSDEAYGRLKAEKDERSFSETVLDLLDKKPRRDIMDLAGVLKDRKDEWEKIKKTIYEDRKRFKIREVSL